MVAARIEWALFFLALVVLHACGPSGRGASGAEVAEEPWVALDYSDARHWACSPELDGDPCRSSDLTATEFVADGSALEVPHEVAAEPKYDCFYLHPTVAFGYTAGNEDDLEGMERVLDPLLQEAARFSSQCRVFAPRYRQIRLQTYASHEEANGGLERAYVDVEAAFRHFLQVSEGRSFALLGHSQGAHVGRRLLERVIALDSALRERLGVAILLGGDVLVTSATGEVANTGGIPLCGDRGASGCVIAYRAYDAERPPQPGAAPTVVGGVPEGLVPACNAPFGGGGRTRLSASYLAVRARQNAFDPWPSHRPSVSTPFVLFRDLYEAECVQDGAGFPYLAISVAEEPDDVRTNRIPFGSRYYDASILGLHVLEFDLALGDLMAFVERAVALRRVP